MPCEGCVGSCGIEEFIEAQEATAACTPERCAYGNFCCPNGCKDDVELDATTAAPVSRKVVVFEETGEEREVVAYCRRCKTDRDDFGIVSPRGMAHHSDGYEGTACGMDATGENWWWRL